ncbi:MAG: lipid A biosynthesis lauroyl acyltransferase [Gammaproteobacteria bacterium]
MNKFYWNPCYWPFWCILGIFRLVTLLPYPMLLFLGKWFGRIAYVVPHYAKTVAKINIEHCFPEYSSQEQKAFLKKNYESLGIAVFETCLARWASDRRLKKMLCLKGVDVLEKLFSESQGVLMVVPHMLTLELAGRLISMRFPFSAFYRPHKKPFIEFLNQKYLKKHFKNLYPRNHIKSAISGLREGDKILFLPDIDAGRKHSVFVPFFGVSTASVTTTPGLVKLGKALLVSVTLYRRDDGKGYVVQFSKPIENYPAGEIQNDVSLINQELEKAIRFKPEQYLWQYRRFKTRPENERRFYPSTKKTSKNT